MGRTGYGQTWCSGIADGRQAPPAGLCLPPAGQMRVPFAGQKAFPVRGFLPGTGGGGGRSGHFTGPRGRGGALSGRSGAHGVCADVLPRVWGPGCGPNNDTPCTTQPKAWTPLRGTWIRFLAQVFLP